MTGPRRHYFTRADGGHLHYLRAGSGAPVLLLHPSPLSASFLRPLVDFLSSRFDVIAIDTPGYGNSDPLAQPADDLAPYVAVIGEFTAGLDVGPVTLYGNATGAQLAIESAKAHPSLVSALVLENAAAFTDDEREHLLQDYFPDLAPREDGSHLALAWRIATQLYQFFPWYDTSEAARFSDMAPPPELVHATAMSYLQAGPDYARAYRAAFANERPERLAAVAQPVSILMWCDSMLLDYSRRLQAADLPGNIRFVEVPGGIEARYNAIRQALSDVQEAP